MVVMETGDQKLKMKPFEGFNYPVEIIGSVADRLRWIKEFDVNSDDVFITSYPKSGTHWVSEITYMLSRGKAEYCRKHNILDFEDVDILSNTSSPRIFITHIPIDRLPWQLLKGKARIINISRNPKDVVISHYCFVRKLARTAFDGPFDKNYLQNFLNGDVPYDSWFRSVQSWSEFPRTHPHVAILYLTYEEMKKNLKESVEKIDQFLELNSDQGLLSSVADKCQFTKTKQDKTDNPDIHMQNMSRTGSQILYRKGEVGDWKNWFTVALNEEFDNFYKEKMRNSIIQFQFTL